MNADSMLKVLRQRRFQVEKLIGDYECILCDNPSTPCCVLLTELKYIDQYINHLEREIWYESEGHS